MTYGYIYKTTNVLNGRIYIGQKLGSVNYGYIGSGKALKHAIIKYGRNNFKLEVIAFATTKQMLDGLEKKHIFEHRQVFGKEWLYNIDDGGQHYKISSLVKISKSNTGLRRSEEEKKIISEKLKGRKFSKETIERMRAAKQGNKNPFFGKSHTSTFKDSQSKKMTLIHPKGTKMLDETKEKISKTLTGFKRSEKNKYNISTGHLKYYQNQRRTQHGILTAATA